MTRRSGLLGLGVAFPHEVRTNDHYRRTAAREVEAVAQRSMATPWAKTDDADANAWDACMEPYLDDPFRGTFERRVLPPGGTALSLEESAARDAVRASGVALGEIDLVIVASFLPDQPGFGNAVPLARALELSCPAWNVESTCSGALIGFETAHALVETRRYRHVLVVQSCVYSRTTVDESVLSWTTGDGATAVVVGDGPGAEVLGTATVSTSVTCGAFRFDAGPTPSGLMLAGDRLAGRTLRDQSGEFVRAACSQALREANVAIGDVAAFVFNTPVAWFARFAARVLGVDPAKTVDAYRFCANVGPALTFTNLALAAKARDLGEGDLVLVFSIGSTSTASAVVLRWGAVGIGPLPDGLVACA